VQLFPATVNAADSVIPERACPNNVKQRNIVIHGFGDIDMAKQSGPLTAHPAFEIAHQRCDAVVRTARRCSAGSPLISRSIAKIASIWSHCFQARVAPRVS
jgi:hypothetical protein